MKKNYNLLFIVLFSFLCVQSLFAETLLEKTDVNGVTRNYYLVLPDDSQKKHSSAIVLLHGLNSSAQYFMDLTDAQAVADRLNSVLLFPEALDEQNENIRSVVELAKSFGIDFLQEFSLEKIWNAGVSIKVNDLISLLPSDSQAMAKFLLSQYFTDKIVLNESVDDISFINNIINVAEENLGIASDSIFMVGASMGGAMAYKYAFSENKQVAAIAVVSGFIGAEVDTTPDLNIPIAIFHSDSDELVNFNGSIFNDPIPNIIKLILDKNGCTEGKAGNFDDISNDGITVKVTQNICEKGKEVLFYESTGAHHADFLKSDYETGPNDIDYLTEIWNFFNSDFENLPQPSLESSIFSPEVVSVSIYPNPATDYFAFSLSADYQIKDISGKILKSGYADQGESVNVSDLSEGIYIIDVITSADNHFIFKLIKK